MTVLRHLLVLLFIGFMVGLSGCELDSVESDDKETAAADTTNTVSDGSVSSGSSSSTDTTPSTGTATLVVVNNSTHHMWPSLDDTTIGGTLIKLPHVDVGQTKSYTIPSGSHWLMIYSAESGMQYEAQSYFTVKPGNQVKYYFDTSLHQ